jgi:citronellol/citronellal dehydrogenase
MGDLSGKTLFVSGGSRGIGLAIAVRAAADGANVALLAKTAEPHPKLAGTIYTAAEEIEAAGGKALPMVGDVRDEESVKGAVAQAAEQFGGIDVVVNNASAIDLSDPESLSMKKYDLMQSRTCAKAITRTSSPSARRSRWTRNGSARTSPTRCPSTG